MKLNFDAPRPAHALSSNYPGDRRSTSSWFKGSSTRRRDLPSLLDIFREAMTGWLNYVPAHKITCSHDATSIEMAVGSLLFTREILGEVLVQQTRHLGVAERTLRRAVLDMLHNNMVAIYGIGKSVPVEKLAEGLTTYYTRAQA